MISRSLLRTASGLALIVMVSGCALIPKSLHWRTEKDALASARPVNSGPTIAPGDAEYAAAVSAIGRRDYAAALDLLQAAREHKPQDVRVMNAFGVVYDKLGRFDLSARYYSQAAALAPQSPIVQANMAYSAQLQKQLSDGTPPIVLGALPPQPTPARPAPAPIVIAAAPAPIVIAAAPQAPVSVPLLGRALVVVNATGAKNGAEAVRLSLVDRGWTAPRELTLDGPAQPKTVITYPAANATIARGLARSLRVRAQLVACANRCQSLRLVLGQDAAAHSTSPAQPIRVGAG